MAVNYLLMNTESERSLVPKPELKDEAQIEIKAKAKKLSKKKAFEDAVKSNESIRDMVEHVINIKDLLVKLNTDAV